MPKAGTHPTKAKGSSPFRLTGGAGSQREAQPLVLALGTWVDPLRAARSRTPITLRIQVEHVDFYMKHSAREQNLAHFNDGPKAGLHVTAWTLMSQAGSSFLCLKLSLSCSSVGFFSAEPL